MDIQLLVFVIPLIAGIILDKILGDPMWLPHPVVGFGKTIHFFEKRLNRGEHKKLKGALTALFLVIAVFCISWLAIDVLYSFHNTIGVIVSSIAVFFCLAGKTLINEVRMVFAAVDRSLEEGRTQVSRIVGRDTSQLTAQEVRTAALETLAENLSDGVIAPLFWFCLLGVPGIMTYKMINTLDSMIGYKNERYKDFGCWAAHIDDVANYIPARLTALLMVMADGKPSLIKLVTKYGKCHASPNSGYPEAALAGILDCRFGGPHSYFGEMVYKPFIGTTERIFTLGDATKAIRINILSEYMMTGIILIVHLLPVIL